MMFRRPGTIPQIIDNLMVYDETKFIMSGQAEAFRDKSPRHNAIEPVRSYTQVLNALCKYTQLKSVIFNTHGSPGHVSLPKGSLTAKEASLLRHNIPILQKNASIFFSGCNVGEGQKGRDFLISIGKNMLFGVGGCVGACDSATFSGFFSIFSLSDTTWKFWGKVRILFFDNTGKILKEIER